MSESTDDAQLSAEAEVVKAAAEPPAPADTDDVEVVAQAQVEAPSAPRHDSVAPTSRKLAPPPKPKRDSNNPGSLPPSAGDPLSSVSGSLKPPATPSISYQDASATSREDVATALAGSDSLRVIGETLAKDAGAFSASESGTGSRPPVPRPRSQPAISAVKDEAPPKSTAIFAQRIISVGTPSSASAAPKPAPSPALDLDQTLESEERPPSASPVAEHVPTAQPPIVAPISVSPPPPPVEVAAEPSVDVQVDEGPSEAPVADIPINTDLEAEEATSPQASVEPLESPRAPSVPDEAPPAEAAAPAEHSPPEDAGPDSADRLQVEELSREDAPSIPPEAPDALTPAMPPPVPAREAKPPPPPKRAPAPPPEINSPEAEKKKSKQKRPWWEEMFSEDFVRANWKVSDEQIRREVNFVEESLGVAPGGVVLDLGCGSGQHAVELASRGYGVVGYDLSLYQLALAADVAQERSQKINFLQGDMREMAFEEMFDGIFCWNTSFGYFEEDKNFSVAERAFRALRPGGMLLVDVMNRDFVAAHTPSSVWFEGDSCVCMDDAVIDYYTSRLRVKRSVILDDGRTRECTFSVRLYSFHELGKLLHEVGFRVTEVSGHPATPGVFLGQASPRILMLAQRP
jgi:SAM-dependent methyltransferase